MRLDIKKTYKLYFGGKFPRSESGRCLLAKSARGEPLNHYSQASRKDFRDAVTAAHAALGGWSRATAYNRGQILYRAAEILQNRAGELAAEIARSVNHSAARAKREVTATVDRLVCCSGWADKYQQVCGSVNGVAAPFFNFTVPDPTGVLALVSLVAPVILSGNVAVVLASEKFPLPAVTFAEVLATSDLPGGVVNILTGKRVELAPHIAAHMAVNAIVNGVVDPETGAKLSAGTATNMKRYVGRTLAPTDWFGAEAEGPYWIFDTVEFKTAWHPMAI